jgi:1,2-diacylglycerol 3-alpha-glucosyltransferase
MTQQSYKVALISTGLGHIRRGIETWTEDLGQALHELGVNVTVYKGGGRAERPYEKVIGCLRRDLPVTKWLIKNSPKFMWRLGFSSPYALEEMTFCWNVILELIVRQFDIIHTQDPEVADFLRTLQKRGFIKSEVILAHGTEEPFEFLARFKYIQHLAPYHMQEMKQKGFDVSKHFAIGNFVDTNLFSPGPSSLREEFNIPEDAFVIACVAAIKKTHKRVDYLIKEVSQLKDKNIFLIIAGAYEEESPEVIKLGEDLLGPRVLFLKNFPRARVVDVLRSANIYILCSLKEMMPIALLEAISCGLPALIHKYPVEEWMIGAGGESLDMSKEGQLKETILKYQNKTYLLEKAKNAREHAIHHFSKKVIVDDILKMYADVTTPRKG